MTALTVVVAARAGEGDETGCLAALAPQVDDVEVLLVRDRADGPAPPWVRVRTVAGGLVPELWAEGLRSAHGDVVAFLAATSMPAPDWVATTRALHDRGHVAVGGPIEPGSAMHASDWAVYFCRYAPYMLPLDGPVDEVAADNGSYARAALVPHAALYDRSFLEPFVHRALRADGHRVAVEPDRVVTVAGHQRLVRFWRQRLLHGREHGRAHAAGRSRAAVVLAAASAPLVPAVMTYRAARVVFAKRRLRLRFAATSPLVLSCYTAWALGELLGRLDVALGRRRS